MGIVVKKAGWQTMVMDQGRRNSRHLGIPVSGVIDLFQYWWANGLVNQYDFQEAGPTVLEIRSGKIEIVFNANHDFALTGSTGQFFLDGVKISNYQGLMAKKNQTLCIKKIPQNGTIYLAIAGTWNVDRVYGSASTDILSPFPGTSGRILKDEDKIEIFPTSEESISGLSSPEYIKSSPKNQESILRLTAGPELHLSDHIKKSLMEDTFFINRNSNRMGYRLEPEISRNHDLPSMISSIVIPGIIQWPSGDQPILLLPNCQTTGGYPRVAKVIDADLWKLAYAGPGDHLHFKWITREEALYLRNYEMGQFTRAWNQTFSFPIKNHLLRY